MENHWNIWKFSQSEKDPLGLLLWEHPAVSLNRIVKQAVGKDSGSGGTSMLQLKEAHTHTAHSFGETSRRLPVPPGSTLSPHSPACLCTNCSAFQKGGSPSQAGTGMSPGQSSRPPRGKHVVKQAAPTLVAHHFGRRPPELVPIFLSFFPSIYSFLKILSIGAEGQLCGAGSYQMGPWG